MNKHQLRHHVLGLGGSLEGADLRLVNPRPPRLRPTSRQNSRVLVARPRRSGRVSPVRGPCSGDEVPSCEFVKGVFGRFAMIQMKFVLSQAWMMFDGKGPDDS